ncbi:heme peroxidase [Roridomyces roridus]|uniref:Peroxidase n=1 Tax=Roridomyces roridus TaxID=1738132 RepID=A0AAD7BAC1_9AGAR|nr:heme peroxidase [Roridomyces roridus]
MFTLFLLSLWLATFTTAYIWPSPKLDALEAVRFDQLDFNRGPITSFIQPCSTFSFDTAGINSGRSNVADWIRTAYHDMATHNVQDGTGGLDASIRFAAERQRPENAGDGFNNTLAALVAASNRYVSIADILALAVVMVVENCGGTEMAFRGGRVDATEPNAPGVPEPQQDLDSHIASFARQGVTQEEMIGLVACGHTFGGVQHDPFPDIVNEMNLSDNTESVAHFDSTSFRFDNNVAAEYITSSTLNPLVVGFNDTTNSDKRIFGSDGNVTMQSFSDSPSLFASTCADLFARMIDTVPRGVELTEVLSPLPVKPVFLELTLANDTLQLSGQVRFWNRSEAEVGVVRMLLEDHLGATSNVTLEFAGMGAAMDGQVKSAWYEFDTSLDPAAGVQLVRFVVNGAVEDQGGVGFAVQDAFLFSETSCVHDVDEQSGEATGRLDVAVRHDTANLSRVYVETNGLDEIRGPTIVETDIPRPAQPLVVGSVYELWSLEVNSTVVGGFTIGAEIGGETYSTTSERFVPDWPFCK